jgi:ATP-binding cassette subfamily B multidrug efflux pump
MIGGVFMALRTDVGLSWLVAVAVPLLGVIVGLVLRPHAAAVPQDAGFDRLGQPDPARADHRHPGRAGLRPRAAREPLRRGQHAPHRAPRWPSAGSWPCLPHVMLIFNVSTVAVLWFGAHRVDRATCRSAR